MALERSTARAPRGTSGAALTGLRASPALRGPFGGAAACVAAVAIVTAAIWLLEPHVPVLSLGVLYVFAVLPVAVAWGWLYAVPVAVASMLAFNFFFLPPMHTLTLADSRNWLALAVYLSPPSSSASSHRAPGAERTRPSNASGSRAARRGRHRAAAGGDRLEEELARIEERTADVLGVSSVRIVLGRRRAGSRPRGTASTLGRRPRRRQPLQPEREEPARSDPAAASARARLAAGGGARARATRARGVRGRSPPPERRDQDCADPAVRHDLRSPLTAIEQAASTASRTRARAHGGRSRAAARDDSRGARRASSASSRTFSTSRGSRREPRVRARSSGPWTTSWRRRWRSSPVPDRVRSVPARSAACERRRRPDPARTRERARERTQVLAPGRARPHACQGDEARAILASPTRGPGFPEEEREHIFEPFHRVPAGPTERARASASRSRGLRRGQRRPALGRVAARPGRVVRARAAPPRSRRRGPA